MTEDQHEEVLTINRQSRVTIGVLLALVGALGGCGILIQTFSKDVSDRLKTLEVNQIVQGSRLEKIENRVDVRIDRLESKLELIPNRTDLETIVRLEIQTVKMEFMQEIGELRGRLQESDANKSRTPK